MYKVSKELLLMSIVVQVWVTDVLIAINKIKREFVPHVIKPITENETSL